jgi:hypothetical protein
MVFDCGGNEHQLPIPYHSRLFSHKANRTKDTVDLNRVFVLRLYCSILVLRIDCIAIQSEVVSISYSLLELTNWIFYWFDCLSGCLNTSGPIVLHRIAPGDSVNSTLLVDLNHDCVIMIDQEGGLSVRLTVALAVARNKRALIIAGIMVVLVCFHGVNSTHTESTIAKTYSHYLVEVASSFMLEATVHHLCHHSPSTTNIKVTDIAVTRYFKIYLNFELLQLIIKFLPLEFFFKFNCHLVEYWYW